MTETKRSSEQEVELNSRLNRLANLPVVKEPLKVGGGTWLVRPSGLPLDIAFVQKGSNGNIDKMSFLGLNICGEESVVGINVRQGKNGVENDLKLLEKNQSILELKARGAQILVMSPSELKNWIEFYEQIENSGLRRDLGERAMRLSGLEKMSAKEAEEQDKALQSILDLEWEYLEKFGVSDVDTLDNVDVVFKSPKKKLISFPIYHVSKSSVDKQVMIESMETRAVQCGGFVVRRIGETERELVLRAEVAEAELAEKLGKPVKVVRVNSNQVNLWQKVGFSEAFKAIESRSQIKAEEVMKFLYLGESSIRPGILSRYPFNLSIPSRGEALSYPGVDIVFWGKGNNGHRKVRGIDNLMVFDKKGEAVPLSNVAGIKIFPEGWSFEEMNDFVKPIKNDLSYRTGLPGAYILNLTPRLFEAWKAQGTPFFQGEIKGNVSLEKRTQYFMQGTAESVYYFQLRQKSEIGGNKNGLMMADKKGNSVTHLWDVGLGFNDMPKGFNGIGRDPNTADGLLRLFRTGVLPMMPGWWEKEYLMQTALKMTGMLSYSRSIKEDIVAQFVVSELVGRCSEQELRDSLPKNVVSNILSNGRECMNKWGVLTKERVISTTTPTHPHWDHMGLFPYLDSDIKFILSGPEIGFVNAITSKAGSWRRRITDRKMITRPMSGGAYERKEVDIQPYYFSGTPIRLSSQLTMEPHFVTHSAPAVWQLYTAKTRSNGVINIFNSGDWNINREKTTLKVAERLAGRSDIMTMEATNMGSEKVYVGKTEADVRDTMLKLVKESKEDAVVAIAPINNLTRLKGLLEVAEASGRKLALSFPHAEFCLQLAAAKEMAPRGAEGFEDVLPYDIGNDNLTLWAKKMTTPKTYHNSLLEIAERGNLGVLTPERLSAENNKWIVVVSPFDVLEDQLDGLRIKESMKVVWMSSFPYSNDQRVFIGANNPYFRRNPKIKFVADMEVDGQGGHVGSRLYGQGVLHVSGHATPEEMVQVTDLLIGPDRKNIPVIINHSMNPEGAGKMLKDRLGDRVNPITRLDRYDPGDPIGHPGYFLKLV